ncbi:Pao retrotransposon peptidase [Teladorsagia circumcincta]|uniref:Pao retrotransposon peptidase n=1 Tax=Teladorsagia circumcincta TaxID=45464 RepID=A0A2G9UN42_TELCI|nr:Pao retrotransposon peptidase [Teladorsagia circumcincta]
MIHTNLGNIFVGKVFNLRNAETYSALQEDTASNSNHYDELSRLVSNFWKLEAIGILDDPAQNDDAVCLKFFNDTIIYDEEHQRKAGMNLREYASNCPELNEFFEREERCNVAKLQKLLGIQWDTSSDELLIHLPKKPSSDIKWTKRKVLKQIASIYDPLGILAPVTLIAKLFLQSLWKRNLGWDETLPDELNNQWQTILNEWTISPVKLNRFALDPGRTATPVFDLHVFIDASGSSYCAVAYIVQLRHSPPHHAFLMMAKSRLAPLHQIVTIPRMELATLTVGAKLLDFITKQLDVKLRHKVLWTDSSVALSWTHNDKALPVFVRNRVKTIR